MLQREAISTPLHGFPLRWTAVPHVLTLQPWPVMPWNWLHQATAGAPFLQSERGKGAENVIRADLHSAIISGFAGNAPSAKY